MNPKRGGCIPSVIKTLYAGYGILIKKRIIYHKLVLHLKGSGLVQKISNVKVGIGFATGRKSFQRVLRTNIYTWKESGLVKDNNISLNLIVAYDLNYNKTKNDRLHEDASEFGGADRQQYSLLALSQ